METTDVKRIVLQQNEAMLDLQRMFCELGRNDLLIIECVRSGVSPEVLAVAAETVRSTLYSVDALADKIRQFSAELQRL